MRKQEFDGFVAIGGGSVMDTAKASNLLSCYPDKELMDFVSAPFGKGEVPMQTLMPLICGMNIQMIVNTIVNIYCVWQLIIHFISYLCLWSW